MDFICCNICCQVYFGHIYMRLNCVTELLTLFYWSMVICRILTCICDVFQWTCMLFGLQNIDWFANYLLVCKMLNCVCKTFFGNNSIHCHDNDDNIVDKLETELLYSPTSTIMTKHTLYLFIYFLFSSKTTYLYTFYPQVRQLLKYKRWLI